MSNTLDQVTLAITTLQDVITKQKELIQLQKALLEEKDKETERQQKIFGLVLDSLDQRVRYLFIVSRLTKKDVLSNVLNDIENLKSKYIDNPKEE